MNQIEILKKSYDLRLLAIDGKHWSINLLGQNMIVSKNQFEKLKQQYSWATDF
jgi:hypothetical protein